MLDFGNSTYYFDLDALDKAVTLKSGNNQFYYEQDKKVTSTINPIDGVMMSSIVEEYERKVPQVKEIDPIKFDLLRYFIEVLVETEDIGDDALGADRVLDKMSFGYKIAFNTLFKQGVVKEEGEEL